MSTWIISDHSVTTLCTWIVSDPIFHTGFTLSPVDFLLMFTVVTIPMLLSFVLSRLFFVLSLDFIPKKIHFSDNRFSITCNTTLWDRYFFYDTHYLVYNGMIYLANLYLLWNTPMIKISGSARRIYTASMIFTLFALKERRHTINLFLYMHIQFNQIHIRLIPL